jgi:galactonate dehydratase
LNVATPNFLIHEIFDEFNDPWETELLTNHAVVRDGYIQLPPGPGIGAELNLDMIERHPYQAGNWLPLFRHGWEKREKQD